MRWGARRHPAPGSCPARPVACAWLVMVLMLAVLPHITRLPLWIICTVFGLGIYRLLHDFVHWRLPPRWLLALLAVASIYGLEASNGMSTSQQGAIALLVILMGLKLLETRTHREMMVLSCIGYFLVMTNVLYSQSMGMLAYLMVVVWLLTVTLIHFQHLGDINRTRLRINLRQGSLLFVQTLPLMVILFVFFPRLDRPLWSLPNDTRAGVTGLSDQLSPGRMTALSVSTAVAFRVKFAGAIPPPALQYWRGLVLWDYDGVTWRRGREDTSPRLIHWQLNTPLYTYTITLEPSATPWLFSLDLPYAFIRHGTTLPFTHTGYYPALGTLTNDFQLRAGRSNTIIKRYTLQSVTSYRLGGLSKRRRRRALRLPASLHERVRNLARQWRQASHSEWQVVTQALQYFQEHGFVYTLHPPPLGADSTYDFLFRTRRGYCAHYASSFTVLMRAAGIPARVVVGYQGGDMNPLGHFLTVRQSHAHAWSEVWLADAGWVRVDPTAVVAPERIERGLAGLSEWSDTPVIIRTNSWLNSVWRGLQVGWDALHYQWDRWVVQYSFDRQRQLMTHIGLGTLSWPGLTLVLVTLFSGIVAMLAWWMMGRHPRPDRLVMAYEIFCKKLTRRGLVRQPYEAPHDFACRVIHQCPELTAQVTLISRLYSALRYGRQQTDADIRRLQEAVRAFRP